MLMLQSGDNGNNDGQGEQEGEDIVGNSEGGEAEGHSEYFALEIFKQQPREQL